jgi:hypothetical protein
MEVSPCHLNASPPAQLALDLSDQWSVKLNHLATALTGEVVMWIFLHGFVVAVAFAKTMLFYQLHLLEQGKGPIDRR